MLNTLSNIHTTAITPITDEELAAVGGGAWPLAVAAGVAAGAALVGAVVGIIEGVETLIEKGESLGDAVCGWADCTEEPKFKPGYDND